MQLIKNLKQSISKKDIILFISFYYVSTLIYYTASWISWGAFKDGHPDYLDVTEFFASGGVQFIVSFFVTIPIWYITSVVLRRYTLRMRLLSHLFFLPIYVALTYLLNKIIVESFGWVMYWGGYKIVWTLYNFTLFYVVQFALIHAYNYFKRFKKEEKEKAVLRETTLKSEITALKSQLNPHFLHNLFNSINATIPTENERTRELIIQLSDLFRYQNYASQNEFVTIKEEIDFVRNYLELMQLRLKERLTFSFEISEELYIHKIAPMLLQPLVENAITHGIASKVEPSSLVIEIKKNGNKLSYSIEDTGTGIKNKDALFSEGLGLSNTKKRLEKIYNSDLNIEDNFPTGTKISFVI